jgi:hypothetical protein
LLRKFSACIVTVHHALDFGAWVLLVSAFVVIVALRLERDSYVSAPLPLS